MGRASAYKLTNAITLDAFANGVSGPEAIATRLHTGVSLRFQY